MKIRPHHLLCTRAFRGKGYSDSFVMNMYSVIEYMKNNKEIELTDGVDFICSVCPKRIDEKCESETKVLSLDANIRLSLKLDKSIYCYAEIEEKIKKLLTEEVFQSICNTCEWNQTNVCKYKDVKRKFG